MSRPTLYIFTISHYCEKAMWALDYLGIDYAVKAVTPGHHFKVAKKLGLKRGSVPILQTENEVIQGSGAIIDWAEKQIGPSNALSSESDKVMQIEQRLDEQLGVHIRRWFYSEAVTQYPATIKPIFMHNIAVWERLMFSLKWPIVQKLMIDKMDLGERQGLESYAIVKKQIEWLDSLLTTENTFLANDQFSRADITAASLLGPIVAPPEHRCSDLIVLPPKLKEQVAELSADSVVLSWVLRLYETHRGSN